MPYISQEARKALDPPVGHLSEEISSVGELNYAITSLVHAWIRGRGVSYRDLNAAIGVLECAKQEFYRRLVVEYENRKIEENGDLPPVEKG